MRAVFHSKYGPPDVLTLRDVAKPAVEDDRALVRVRASSVNSLDWRLMRGEPYIVRLRYGLRRPKTGRLGVDAAGVVEAVGKNVTHVEPGDEVFGVRNGAFSEYVSGRTFVPKPANLTFEEAAAVPVAGCTALQALRDRGEVRAGQRVLVNGAGGGVGTFVVQLARAFGADVTAVTSTAKLELVRSLGAKRVIDYGREDFTTTGDRYDVVLDVGGNRSIAGCLGVLTPAGTLVLVGAGRGGWGPLGRMAGGLVRSRLLKQRLISFEASVTKDDLMTLKELIESGKVRPVIDSTFPLHEAAAAIRRLESGLAHGKVVITT